MNVVHLASITDARLDDYRNVPDPELLRDRGIFVAEGRHVVRRLLTRSRFRTRSVLVTSAALHSLSDVLSRADDVPIFVVDPDALNAVTGFNIHRGCLAIGERLPLPGWRAVTADARRVVVLEQVSNADNVGSVFRNAAAFGVDTVLLGPRCTDPLYRKAIRTSMGAALRIPFSRMERWPADLYGLKEQGFGLMALTPAADADLLRNVAQRFSAADRVALLLGHEGEGLSPAAIEAADVRVRIPMAEGVDSLNVATAAAIALYVLSQR